MKNKTHRPFAAITLFFASGIILNNTFVFTIFQLFTFIVFLLLLYCFVREHRKISMLLIFVLFISLGSLYAHVRQVLPRDDIYSVSRYYRGRAVMIQGRIVSDVEERSIFRAKKKIFVFEVQKLETKWGWRDKRGKIFVHLFAPLEVFYGDQLIIEGKLHPPHEFSDSNFSYRDYMRNKGIRLFLSVKKTGFVEILGRNQGNRFKARALRLRNECRSSLENYLSVNESGIMKAILLGDRSHIPKHVRELFVKTGTAHILAISGLHVGVVAMMFLVFVKLLPMNRGAQYALTILLLIGYASITGGRPSVMRATIMTIVFLLSMILERDSDQCNTISFTAFILLLMNPFNLFDIGFQLSFVCVYSIILLSPKFKSFIDRTLKIENRFVKGFIIHPLMVSVSIGLGVGGFMVYYFNIFTPVMIIANLIIVPFIGVIVILGFGLMMSNLMLPFFVVYFALCIKLALNIMVGVIYLFEKIPYAYFYIKNVTSWHIMIYYIILICLFFIPWSNILKRLYNTNINIRKLTK